MGFCEPEIIASGSVLIVPKATKYHFGILTSSMHMAWMRHMAGRMKSDYQYSNTLVYNTFPWPDSLTPAKKGMIAKKAENVLSARKKHAGATLAERYDVNLMPRDLVKAHSELDRAVEAAYGLKANSSDIDKMKVLFELYQANL